MMRTISIDLDDDLYVEAERKASALQKSVGDVVADYLRHWAAETPSLEEARQALKERFARQDWEFAVGTPDDREQRNARR